MSRRLVQRWKMVHVPEFWKFVRSAIVVPVSSRLTISSSVAHRKLQFCGEYREYYRFECLKLLILNIDGGGWGLERTDLYSEFPANREKYREICEIGP